jgi:hypothetical protein
MRKAARVGESRGMVFYFRGRRKEERGRRLQSEARGLFTVYSLQFTDDYIKR